MRTKFIQTIRYQDLPEEMQNLADVIGIEMLHKLLEYFGGVRMYVPTPESFTEVVRRYIVDNYTVENGRSNIRDLARETGLTQETVRRLYRSR